MSICVDWPSKALQYLFDVFKSCHRNVMWCNGGSSHIFANIYILGIIDNHEFEWKGSRHECLLGLTWERGLLLCSIIVNVPLVFPMLEPCWLGVHHLHLANNLTYSTMMPILSYTKGPTRLIMSASTFACSIIISCNAKTII
jgi:hypothetical protein